MSVTGLSKPNTGKDDGFVLHSSDPGYKQYNHTAVFIRICSCSDTLTSGQGSFSPHHRVQTSSGSHPASYPMDTRASFSGGRVAGVVKLITPTIHLHGTVLS
jgi:hypothetical protein